MSGEGGVGWGFIAQGCSGNGFPLPGSEQGCSQGLSTSAFCLKTHTCLENK